MEIICCLCHCCCANYNEERDGLAGICLCIYCCYKGYKENISDHKRRTYRFLNIVLVLILSIVAVVLSSIILATNSSSTTQMKNILNNWQQGVLLEIIISTACPMNYEILSIYEIPGTQQGCICIEDKELFSSSCTDWQLLTGCYNFNPKSSIQIKQWVQPSNNSYQAVQICGRRSKLNFYDLLENKTITEEDCNKNGYKVCQTQNPENFYCVLQDEPCPIREFKISQYQLSNYELELNNYTLIYDNGFYAYTSQSTEITPLVNMIITKGKGVCFDSSEISLNPKLDQDYILLSPIPYNCEIDNTYLQISKTTESALFSMNNIANLIIQERPLYQISNNIEYQLLAQNQIYYKKDCRLDNFEQITSLGERFDSQNILITCQLVFACIELCVFLFFTVTEVQPCLQKECKSCYQKIFIILKEVSIYLVAITVIVSYSYMIDLILNLEEQNSRNCFLSTAQERMNSVYDTLNGTSLSLSYCLLINMGIIIILDFIMSTFLCYKIYNKRRFYKTSKFDNQQNKNKVNNIQTKDQVYNQNETPFQNQEQYSNQYCSQNPNQNFSQNPFMQQQNYSNYPNQIQYNPTPQTYNYQIQPNYPPQYVGNQIQENEMINQKQKENENNCIIFQEN
ncbi:unnamed protein product [Paramecium sonneborni]|uniref:Transmembrane protein n=1 Tax=Paramecium sonneborni TaxID=65129 RepID=A0A8S1KII7_9CILI|nr:unnamed protein product [Paramecium sonneborni]